MDDSMHFYLIRDIIGWLKADDTNEVWVLQLT
jgi:hypothetical protein